MAKSKSIEPHVVKQKVFTSADEISQAIVKLRARIHQVEELKKDGLPYRDALRVTAEYQVRDTIREIFGDRSPEYVEHQHLKIKINSKHAVNETVALLQHLVVGLEEKRLEILGLRPRPSETPPTPPSPPVPPVPTPVPLALTMDAPTAPVSPLPTAGAATKLKLSAEVPILVQDSTEGSPRSRPAAPPPSGVQSAAAHPHAQEISMSPSLNLTTGTPTFVNPGESAGGREAREPSPRAHLAPEMTEDGSLALLRKICGKFHRVARQLRQRRDERPTLDVEDERDMTDLLHALLSLEFDDIEVEEWSPSYAEGTTRGDLCLKDEGIVVMAKKTRQGLGAKGLTQQISADFERYASHPSCKTLFCFIYDPEGRIGNPKGLEGDLTLNYNGRRVEVLISPK